MTVSVAPLRKITAVTRLRQDTEGHGVERKRRRTPQATGKYYKHPNDSGLVCVPSACEEPELGVDNVRDVI